MAARSRSVPRYRERVRPVLEKQVFWLLGLVGRPSAELAGPLLFCCHPERKRGTSTIVVLRKIAWTATHAREVSHRPRGSDDKT
jgi:hypothetical protein